MSRDIRQYFSKGAKSSRDDRMLQNDVKAKVVAKESHRGSSNDRKRRRVVRMDEDSNDGDGDDVIEIKSKKVEAKVHQNADFEKTLQETVPVLLKKPEKGNKTPVTKKATKRTTNDKDFIDDDDDEGHVPKKKKSKVEKKEESTSIDFEADEKLKRRKNAFLSFINRSGPANPGSKEVPIGAEGCFEGLCFVITGVMDSLTSEEIREIVLKYGGRCVTSVSGKVNFMVVGKDPGPAKMEKAENLGTKMITEDEFLKLIVTESEPLFKKGVKKIVTEDPFTSQLEELSQTQEQEQEPSETVKIETSIETSLSQLELKRNDDILNWVDKYKPKSMKDIIGQFGDKSLSAKLYNWLKNWYQQFAANGKTSRATYYNQNNDGSEFKVALLSGPPGVGKTTTANIVAKELGFDIVEFNASDTRNKNLLVNQVSELIGSQSLAQYAIDGKTLTKNQVLLMDEVDGMSGNEDRGGIQELVSLIKKAKMPIICICNDRQHPKIRTLANYCLDLRFTKPRLDQIKGAMMSICFKESIKMKPDLLGQIIVSTNNDIRQTINYLSLLSAGGRMGINSVNTSNMGEKPGFNNPWEITKKIFNKSENAEMSLNDRSDLFFTDYSAIPLFVQENYVKVIPDAPRNQLLNRMAKTAESLSIGDMIESRIRSSGSWELLTSQAIFSCVLPSYLISGRFNDMIGFPSWFGKNSKQTKFKRLISELHSHFRYRSTCDGLDLIREALCVFRKKILLSLKKGMNGIEEAIQMMHDYYLLREDLDSILELSQWPNTKLQYEDVNSKVKAAFTRTFNRSDVVLPYSTMKSVTAKKRKVATEEDYLTKESESVIDEVEDSDDEDPEKDTMIKLKKPSAKKKNKKLN